MKKLFVIAAFMLSLVCIFTSCDIIPSPQEKEDVITIEDGYLVVNGVKTEYKVDDGKEPEVKEDVITVDEDGYVIVNGIKTEYNVNSGDDVTNESNCTHAERIENEVKPACDKSGSFDLVTYCIKCGKEFGRICVITEMLPHTESAWIVDKAATCTESGLRHKECTVCGVFIESEITPTTGHNYVDGSCTNCGKADPDYIPEIPAYSVGLEYTSNGNGTCYVSGIGTCTDTDIVIPSVAPNGQKVVAIGNSAFSCNTMEGGTYKVITSIHLPDTITVIERSAFSMCDLMTEINIPNSVTAIQDMAFSGCTSLASIEIPDSVTRIGYDAFFSCTSLKSIVIPGSIQDFSSYAFARCTSLENVVLADGITIGGEGVFFGCTSLTNVSISNTLTSINRDTFRGCTSLTSIKIPDNITSIGDYAFDGCTNLSSILIPDSIANISYEAFSGCDSLYAEYEGGKYIRSGDNIYAVLIGITDKNISSFNINGNTKHIAERVFENCTSLTNIVIPDSVKSISSYAFQNCSLLVSAVIGDNVENIGASVFHNCSMLSSIIIGDNVKRISSYAFTNTHYYNDVNNWENDVLYIGNYLISAKKTIYSKYVVKEGTTVISSYAFSYCTNLTSIEIPNSVKFIGHGAFSGCTSLTSVLIPDSITSIELQLFRDCTNLMNIKIPNSVTSIGSSAFWGCTNLTSIEIPNSVTSIDSSAFGSCTNLDRIYYVGSGNDWNKIVINNVFDSNSSLINASCYYYSETQPTTTGNFWHYVDGVPTVW